MLKLFCDKLKESAFSIIPVVLIIFILSFTPLFDMTINEKIVFIIGAILLIISMGLFNLGASISMTSMGELAGVGLIKTKKFFVLILSTFVMGFLTTIAEPDLKVLANQVEGVIDDKVLIITIAVGVGLFLVISIFKILFHKQLAQILMVFYFLVFSIITLLFISGKSQFLPLAFDSGGVTTGPITVPFIMSFGYGIASSVGGKDSNENSFGMVSLSSIGPILVVLALTLFSSGSIDYVLNDYSIENYIANSNIIFIFLNYIKSNLVEVGKALLLILFLFFILQFTILKLPISKIFQILLGLVFTFIGLVGFLSSASLGFLPIGQSIGFQLSNSNSLIVVLFGFILGMCVVLAEPAIHVLNEQVEEVTAGAVTKSSMMLALSIGVGTAIALSLLRIIFGFSLIYYLIPGYFISLALSLFVPPIYTSIAFDSGGVASGPMASTFILPFAIGFCSKLLGDSKVLDLAFGIISMIAMTPLITIQLLGFSSVASRFVKNRISMNRILSADDNQIVYFDINYLEV